MARHKTPSTDSIIETAEALDALPDGAIIAYDDIDLAGTFSSHLTKRGGLWYPCDPIGVVAAEDAADNGETGEDVFAYDEYATTHLVTDERAAA